MPEISRFYGIIICMYFDDHNPPHFHARYNEQRVAIAIANLNVIDGALCRRALALVREWAARHRLDLQHNWDSLRLVGEFHKITPLE